MNQNTCEPAVIHLPLSSLENMQMELSWKIEYAIENDHFRRTMQPIVRNHHERQNRCSTPSSPLQPLFDKHSLSTAYIYPPSVSGDNNSP